MLNTMASLPSGPVPLHRTSNTAPLVPIDLHTLIDVKLKAAYKSTYGGKFAEALAQFTNIIHYIALLVTHSKKEAKEAQDLLAICREHALGLRIELGRKETNDIVRQTELAAYFTHCKLEPNILRLSLRSAMTQSFKIKNFLLAANFARRLLELEPPEEVEKAAKKVIQASEKEPSNAHPLQYNEKNPFTICAATFTPIYKGSPSLTCPFCQSSFVEAKRNSLCGTCNIAQVGAEASGLLLFQETKRQKKAKKQVEEEEEDEGW